MNLGLSSYCHGNPVPTFPQVFYKHHGARFFRAKAYAMALVIAGIPFSFMEVRRPELLTQGNQRRNVARSR